MGDSLDKEKNDKQKQSPHVFADSNRSCLSDKSTKIPPSFTSLPLVLPPLSWIINLKEKRRLSSTCPHLAHIGDLRFFWYSRIRSLFRHSWKQVRQQIPPVGFFVHVSQSLEYISLLSTDLYRLRRSRTSGGIELALKQDYLPWTSKATWILRQKSGWNSCRSWVPCLSSSYLVVHIKPSLTKTDSLVVDRQIWEPPEESTSQP